MITLNKNLANEYKIITVGLTEDQMDRLPKLKIGFTRTNSIKDLAELYSIADIFVNLTIEGDYLATNIGSNSF